MATYNDNSCVASLGKTGLANCVDNLGADARLLYTLDSFEFATYADSIDESKYEDAINAGNMFPFPQFQVIEPTSEDDVIEETTLGEKLFVREGKYSGTGSFELAMCNLSTLRTFNEVLGRAFIITVDGQLFGTSPDGIKFRGFKLSEFHMSGINGTDGTTKRKVDLRYQLRNPNEMNDYPAIPTLTWDPLELAGVINTTFTVESSAAGSVVVKVLRNCDNEAVTGLVVGDFTMLASDGTTEMLPGAGVTDNADGTYTFSFTTPVLPADTYTVNLKTPSNQTTGGYYSASAVSFTIT